jgi:hypothetical protein
MMEHRVDILELKKKLAAQRELTDAEREQAMANPSLRDQLMRAQQQDALLSALPQPRVSTAVIGRVLSATTLAPARNQLKQTWARRWAGLAAALVLTVALSSTGYAAAQSLPGDTLYPVKRDAEHVRMALTFDPGQRLAYQQRLGARRLAEAGQVLARGRQNVQLDFDGILQQDADGNWNVSGLPVTLDAGFVATPGVQVQVRGATEGRRIRVRLMQSEPSSGLIPAGSTSPLQEGSPSGSQHRYGQPTAEPSATSLQAGTAGPVAPADSTPMSTGSEPADTPTVQSQPSLQQGGATGTPAGPQQGQTVTPQSGPKGGKH